MREDTTLNDCTVCFYCSNLVLIEVTKGGSFYAHCSKVKDAKGTCAAVTSEKEMFESRGVFSVDGLAGCDKFKSSGMPAKPGDIEGLVRQNELCRGIPADTSMNGKRIEEEISRYLNPSNIIPYEKRDLLGRKF